MRKFYKPLSVLLAFTMCVSLIAPVLAEEGLAPLAVEESTLSDKILKPGKEDIIDEANDNAQELLDETKDALEGKETTDPVEPTDPTEPAEPTTKPGDILVDEKDEDAHPVYEQAKDEAGNPKVDEEGNPVYVQDTNEDGTPKVDENGNPVYKVVANVADGEDGVLDKADEAKENAEETEQKVDEALTVTVTEGEGEDAQEVSKSVDEAVKAEADKAKEALEEINGIAQSAADAVAAGNQAALDQAKADAADAAAKAETAYNNAQSIFDNVIDEVLKGEDGTVSEETKKAIDEKVAEAMKDVAVPGEDAADEEKAAYESKLVSARNAAKKEVANAKIETMYNGANEQIKAAKDALENAETALTGAKATFDSALVAKKLVADGSSSDIEAYVGFFKDLNADSETAKKVSDAYNNLDTKKNDAKDTKIAADQEEKGVSDKVQKNSPAERILRDATWDKAPFLGTDIKTANTTVNQAVEFVLEQYKIITSGTASQEEIDAAKSKLFDEKMDKWWDFADLDSSDSNVIKVIDHRLDRVPAQKTKLMRLVANLYAEQAAYEQEKAQKELDKTLAGLTDLDYKKALEVVKALSDVNSTKVREELKDAAAKLEAQKQAAEEAAQNVAKAEEAYDAALAAVKQAMEELKAAELTKEDLAAQQAKLDAALADLEVAKENKEQAEEVKREIDRQVIETEEEIRGGGTDTTTGGTGDGGDSGVSIEDQAVPLAGLVTRAEFLDYLWRHEGSPAADAPTFPDVPADHDFAQAIGWGQANRLVVGYPDGNFYPDETVTVQMVRIILGCFSDVFGTNAVAVADLKTLTGEDGDVVMNCAEVLAEFFGEEYVSAANGEDDIDVDVAA